MNAETKKTYLGDSVYAEFDGFGIWLTTENGLPGDPSNRIFLESEVLHALELFKKSFGRIMNDMNEEEKALMALNDAAKIFDERDALKREVERLKATIDKMVANMAMLISEQADELQKKDAELKRLKEIRVTVTGKHCPSCCCG